MMLLRDTNPWREWSQRAIDLEAAAIREAEARLNAAIDAGSISFDDLVREMGYSSRLPALRTALIGGQCVVTPEQAITSVIGNNYPANVALLAEFWNRECAA